MKTSSEQETQAFAKNLVNELKPPTVFALQGSLGAGKTTFVQGLAAALGIKKRVLSPTFVFLRSYPVANSKFKFFHHFDLYRCSSLEDVESTGLVEFLESTESLIVIEWPEIAQDILPEYTSWIKFEKTSDQKREISVS